MKRTLLVGLVMLGAIGCGSGGGGRTGGVVTYSYASNEPFSVPPGTCGAVVGPVDVNGDGTMFYSLVDASPDTDSIEAVIISDSFYATEGCGFTYSQTVMDESFVGSNQDSGPALADTYDFVVSCNNLYVDCVFNLTWNATY